MVFTTWKFNSFSSRTPLPSHSPATSDTQGWLHKQSVLGHMTLRLGILFASYSSDASTCMRMCGKSATREHDKGSSMKCSYLHSVLPSILNGHWPNMPSILMRKWSRVKRFDVVSGSTQTPPSQCAFTLNLGKTLLYIQPTKNDCTKSYVSQAHSSCPTC